jgi:hypothetical protein
MSSVATETTVVHPPERFAQASRSPVLSQFRTNPFRVLRVPPDIGAQEAVWKSEEALSRIRAGLALSDGELIPWLPDPEEPEIRHAVQRIEEPLRRLTDQLFWFDPEHDGDGTRLRRALRSLEADLLEGYLGGGLCEVRSEGSRAPGDQSGGCAEGGLDATSTEAAGQEGGRAPGDESASTETTAVPRLLNHANLSLLLAGLSLHDALPDGGLLETGGSEGKGSDTIRWGRSKGLDVSDNPHALDLSMGGSARRARQTMDRWTVALARWVKLVTAPAFLAFVQANIARLEDDVVGADDAEVVVNSVTTRLTDLLVGEVKVQLMAGRIDSVRALMEAAAKSEIEPRRWGMAFRSLRPLFRTEAAELEPLLAREGLHFDDCSLYFARLKTLRARWASVDSAAMVGLDELADDAVLKGCEALASLESFPGVDRLKTLYGTALGLAAADSLKERISAMVTRVNGFEHYACHFCKSREMNLERSVVIKGKRESHRTYGFNSTTVHYLVNANIVPRCARCSTLHSFCWDCSSTIRQALGVALAFALVYLVRVKAFGSDPELGGFLVFGAAAALVLWLSGLLARRIAALLATPRGERRYWRASTAKSYQEMESEGYKLSVDYRPDAFKNVNTH